MTTELIGLNKNKQHWKGTEMTDWRRATPADVPAMVALSDINYNKEFESVIFTKNLTRLHYHLHQAILTQTYQPDQTCVLCAQTDRVLAWSWAERHHFTPYSDDEMAVAEILHIDTTLSARRRIQLVRECIGLWTLWARTCDIPVLVSSTIRPDQSAFMRLHEQAGFDIRGSFAYKRLKEFKGE